MLKNTKWVIFLAILMILGGIAFVREGGSFSNLAAVGGAFDEFGYNDKARIFNGTGESWCVAGEQSADCMGAYSSDKLVMKWTEDWDRGNDEGWLNPPYDKAWTDNEWNGKGKGGSGEVWHYKIKWYGSCTDGAILPGGGECIWGQFAVIMDQGVSGKEHIWFTKATPNGYGSRKD